LRAWRVSCATAPSFSALCRRPTKAPPAIKAFALDDDRRKRLAVTREAEKD
jgi:hypothetical protein